MNIMKVIKFVLRLILRPTVESVGKEFQEISEIMWERIVMFEPTPEQVQRALKYHVAAIRTSQQNEIIQELVTYFNDMFSDILAERGVLLKADLLTTEEYWKMLKEKQKMQQEIFGNFHQIMTIKLVNAMAEVDFKKTFGQTREEWEKQIPQDKVDETIKAIAKKEPLPPDVAEVLTEVNGIVPFNFDYETMN